jgi:hypothetical protein
MPNQSLEMEIPRILEKVNKLMSSLNEKTGPLARVSCALLSRRSATQACGVDACILKHSNYIIGEEQQPRLSQVHNAGLFLPSITFCCVQKPSN